jgi:cysteine sulfinate desulfinase/cysteine desulfurase-like protein
MHSAEIKDLVRDAYRYVGPTTAAVAHNLYTPAAATGAACPSATPEPSPVLLAMGHDPGRARSAFRLTLGRWTTRNDIEQAAHQVAA